jgi:hypothetical protein
VDESYAITWPARAGPLVTTGSSDQPLASYCQVSPRFEPSGPVQG